MYHRFIWFIRIYGTPWGHEDIVGGDPVPTPGYLSPECVTSDFWWLPAFQYRSYSACWYGAPLHYGPQITLIDTARNTAVTNQSKSLCLANDAIGGYCGLIIVETIGHIGCFVHGFPWVQLAQCPRFSFKRASASCLHRLLLLGRSIETETRTLCIPLPHTAVCTVNSQNLPKYQRYCSEQDEH